MRKIKKFNKDALRRKGYILLNDDMAVPIFTRGDITLQNIVTEYEKTLKLPKANFKPATKQQVEDLRLAGYEVHKTPFMIRQLDYTSPEYYELIKQKNQYENLMKIVIHIDYDYTDDDGTTWWEAYNLKDNKDFNGMVERLQELDMSTRDIIFCHDCIEIIRKSNCRTYEEYEKYIDEILN